MGAKPNKQRHQGTSGAGRAFGTPLRMDVMHRETGSGRFDLHRSFC